MLGLFSTAAAVLVVATALIVAPIILFIVVSLLLVPRGGTVTKLNEKRKKLNAINAQRKAAGQKPLALRDADKRVEDRSNQAAKAGAVAGTVAFAVAIAFTPWLYESSYDLAHNAAVSVLGESSDAAPPVRSLSPSEQADSIVKGALDGTTAEVLPGGVAKVRWEPNEAAPLVYSQINYVVPRFMPKLFEQIPGIKSVTVTGIGTKKDDYGHTRSDEVCSLTFTRETASKVNWAEVDGTKIGRIADEFTYNPSMLPQ